MGNCGRTVLVPGTLDDEREDAIHHSGAKYDRWDLVAVSMRWEYMTKAFIQEQWLLKCYDTSHKLISIV